MTTIHDLTDDDVRLFDLFMILDDRGQGEALKQVAVTGCHAVAERTASADGSAFDLSPKAATLDALHRCRPRLPSGWASDSDFEFEVENAVVLKLDPNVWFDYVERVASQKIGRETVTYVSNIYKYYVSYLLVQGEYIQRRNLKKPSTPGK